MKVLQTPRSLIYYEVVNMNISSRKTKSDLFDVYRPFDYKRNRNKFIMYNFDQIPRNELRNH